jgi:hypothetical protein
MFGGNSNWRGPIWMPVNGLIIRALLEYYTYYGNGFIVDCPTGSRQQRTLYQVAEELTRRLTSIFWREKDGHRPVYGGTKKFQEDPHRRDYISFYEYSTAILVPDWEQVIKPAGPVSLPVRCTCLQPPHPSRLLNSAKGGLYGNSYECAKRQSSSGQQQGLVYITENRPRTSRRQNAFPSAEPDRRNYPWSCASAILSCRAEPCGKGSCSTDVRCS